MPKNYLYYLPFLILIPSLILNFIFYQKIPKNPNTPETYTVKQILDGDTFVLNDNIIVRLFSIEAPELTNCGGDEAKKVLENLILNKKVTLDVKIRDSYGRLVALVYQNNKLINKELLLSGWLYYNGMNYEGKEELKTINQNNKDSGKGIYSRVCNQKENPADHKCLIKGKINNASDDKIYHFPGCGRYEEFYVEKFRGEQWFCSEKEALADGFTKSKNCFDKKFPSSP